MDYTTLDQMIEKDLGPVGTTERDQFEAEAKERIEAWRLGEKVKEARKAQNLTQKELGERIGVGEAQISKIERAESPRREIRQPRPRLIGPRRPLVTKKVFFSAIPVARPSVRSSSFKNSPKRRLLQ